MRLFVRVAGQNGGRNSGHRCVQCVVTVSAVLLRRGFEGLGAPHPGSVRWRIPSGFVRSAHDPPPFPVVEPVHPFAGRSGRKEGRCRRRRRSSRDAPGCSVRCRGDGLVKPLASPSVSRRRVRDAMEMAVAFTGGLAGASGPALRVGGVPGKLGGPQALQALRALQMRGEKSRGRCWPWAAMLPILWKSVGGNTPQFPVRESSWSSMSRSFVGVRVGRDRPRVCSKESSAICAKAFQARASGTQSPSRWPTLSWAGWSRANSSSSGDRACGASRPRSDQVWGHRWRSQKMQAWTLGG